jgi:DNA-binding cell septation regulator SpoVG
MKMREIELMKLTDIEIRLVKNSEDGSLKAFASLTLDGVLKLTSFSIHSNDHLVWVTHPILKTRRGEIYQPFILLSGDLRKLIEKKLIEEYKELIKDVF